MKDRSQEIVNIYKRILGIVFDRLSPTFGQRTIGAIVKNVLARQGKKHKILLYLKVTDQGMNWQDLETHLGEVSMDQLSAGLEEFLDEFFDAISNLIGRLIVGKLFKEAEEMAKRGEAE